MPRDVLVIVPTYSRQHTIAYTIASILNQTYSNFNLAIIGDGVSDEYKKIIQKIAESDDRIHFYDNPKSKRVGEPYRNSVIKEFNPKYITYCGDDDLFISNHIEKMLDEIKGYDFVHPLAYWVMHRTTDAKFFDRFLDDPNALQWLLDGNNFISLTGAMHTKEIFDRTDGWTTTPEGTPTDRYMWGKFFALDNFKAKSSRLCTTIKISHSGVKKLQGVDLHIELETIKQWHKTINKDMFMKQWEQYIKNVVLKSSKYLKQV